MMKTTSLFLVSVFFVIVGCAQIVSADELRPLNLPSTQQNAIQQQRPVESSSSSMYKAFEDKVRKMDRSEKDAYKDRYTTAFKGAVQDNDTRRIEHFSRLLNILNRY